MICSLDLDFRGHQVKPDVQACLIVSIEAMLIALSGFSPGQTRINDIERRALLTCMVTQERIEFLLHCAKSITSSSGDLRPYQHFYNCQVSPSIND